MGIWSVNSVDCDTKGQARRGIEYSTTSTGRDFVDFSDVALFQS